MAAVATNAQSEEIAEIQVTIYGARDFLAKDEQPKPVYVVFGVGSSLFRTETKLEPSPDWNEYQKFKILSRHVPLRITLHKQSLIDSRADQVVGKISKAIQSIAPKSSSRPLYAHFQSNFASPCGYLMFECSVTQYRPIARCAAVEWTKQQAPRVTDFLRHPDCPSSLRDSLCCIKLFGPSNESIIVEGARRKSQADSFLQPSPIIVKSLLTYRSRSVSTGSAQDSKETNQPSPMFVSCQRRKSLAPGYAQNTSESDIERFVDKLRSKAEIDMDISDQLGRRVKFLADVGKNIAHNVDDSVEESTTVVPMDRSESFRRKDSLVRQLKKRVSELESANAVLEQKLKEQEKAETSPDQVIVCHL